MKKRFFAFLLLILLVFALTACGSENNDSGGYYPAYDGAISYEKNASSAASENDQTNNVVVIDTTNKIVYTASYTMNVGDIQKVKNTITSKVIELEGYISNSSESEKSATITYKVPTNKLNGFLDYIDSLEGVGDKNITTEDITNSYSQTEGRIEILEASKLAYEKILREENLTYNDIILINKELAEINSELAYYRNVKDTYDNRLNYSRVTIRIYGNSTYRGPSFFDEYFDYLGKFFIGLGKGILYSIPVLLVLFGVFAAIFFPLYSKSKKNRKNAQEKKDETK